MASQPLQNYLRTNRKRLALSQDDVAFLVGRESGAKVCRYEMFTHTPGLETAIAYEVIFQKPMRELFAGLYQNIEKEVVARAEALARRPEPSKANWRTARRRQTIAGIAAIGSDTPFEQ